jgi:hypothetical protein
MKEELVQQDILYQLINYENNRQLLEGVPHIPYLDMAIVFYYMIDEKIARMVTKEDQKKWDCTPGELERLATYNTPRKMPVLFKPLEDMVKDILGRENPFQESCPVPMHILTNQKLFLGASSILYPQVLWAVSQSLQDDLYIIPSSIHECIIIPSSSPCSPGELKKMISEVNETVVNPWEILSKHVLIYSKSGDSLRI